MQIKAIVSFIKPTLIQYMHIKYEFCFHPKVYTWIFLHAKFSHTCTQKFCLQPGFQSLNNCYSTKKSKNRLKYIKSLLSSEVVFFYLEKRNLYNYNGSSKAIKWLNNPRN